jgi:hypothetical protein
MIARLGTLLRRAVRDYARYLVHVAWTHNPVCLVPPEDTGPGPGHPEKLVVHVPPSEVERALWAQLSPG